MFRVSLLTGFAWLTFASVTASPQNSLMPVPSSIQDGSGRLELSAKSQVLILGGADARLHSATLRALRRLEERTGLVFARTSTGEYAQAGTPAEATLIVESSAPGAAWPTLGEDESYMLTVSSRQAVLQAPTTLGAMHGLETLLQLVQSEGGGWFVPAVALSDRPRFPWRGLMIDVCRHWLPMDVIKRNLDLMAVVKLNVLHLHLTEDQGFRIESKTFSRLHKLGSDGQYYTQDQMREIIAYAGQRGIRVVPEFDMPGHATSWVVGYPELASAPGPYQIERQWGVFDPVLDPTNPKVYELLEGFLGEMAALFPDPYLHIGGDENNGVQWSANPQIQAFIREHNLKDNAGLHAYFNRQVNEILSRHGKKLVGWDEILHPQLPAGSVVHSWRGPDGIAAATERGYPTILSNGYYIDLCHPASDHYLTDPAPSGAKLTDAQRALVLGGEATMWAEWVSPETVDSRIWPRTAAIAERLWSRAEIRDVPDMYRRLAMVSQRLEEAGAQHRRYVDPALRRLAGEGATTEDLRQLRWWVDLIEPVKEYVRGQQQPEFRQSTPLTSLADCARPDSQASREFAAMVDEFIASPKDQAAHARVAAVLAAWHVAATGLLNGWPRFSRDLAATKSLLSDFDTAVGAGDQAREALSGGRPLDLATQARFLDAADRAAKSRFAVEIPAAGALRKLIAAAGPAPK